MPRSIEEIQRDLEQTDQNLNSIARQTQRIDRGLHVLDEQEKNVAGRALAPTQIENKRMLTEIHGSVDAIESSVAVIEEEMRSAVSSMHRAYTHVSQIDVESINQSTRDMNELLELADPQQRSKLIEALDAAYDEKKRVLEKAYQEEKQELDRIIEAKKEKVAELDKKAKKIQIKDIVKKTLIAVGIIAVVLFVSAVAVRWGTILRNKVDAAQADQAAQTKQTKEIKAEENKGLFEWIFPTSE